MLKNKMKDLKIGRIKSSSKNGIQGPKVNRIKSLKVNRIKDLRIDKIKDMKIRTKLGLMIFIPLLSVLILSIAGIINMNRNAAQLTRTYYDNLYKTSSSISNANKELLRILSLKDTLNKMGADAKEKENSKKAFKESIEKVKSESQVAYNNLLASKHQFESLKDPETSKNVFDIYNDFQKQFYSWLNTFSQDTGKVKNIIEFDRTFIEAENSLRIMAHIVDDNAINVKKDMHKETLMIEIRYTAIALVSFILTILFGALIIADSTKALMQIKVLATRLSQYDFSTSLYLNRKDEYGQTADTLNTAQENVRDLITNIMTNSEQINASSEILFSTINEVSSNFEVINNSTKQINVSIQENSAIAEELSASIQEVDSSITVLSSKASEGTDNASQIMERANVVKNNSEQAIDATNKIYLEKETTIVQAIEAGKVVSEIGVMANTIAGIAQQTNLLALNAAIEAARAGEQGKGFAVVADEVRRLAEQSSQAVHSVKETIEKVKKAFDNLSSNSSELIQFMQKDVRAHFEGFNKIGLQYREDADFVNTMSSELSGLSQEINVTVNEVNDAIQNMARMTQESSERTNVIEQSINESSETMSKLNTEAQKQAELAHKLNEMVSSFVI